MEEFKIPNNLVGLGEWMADILLIANGLFKFLFFFFSIIFSHRSWRRTNQKVATRVAMQNQDWLRYLFMTTKLVLYLILFINCCIYLFDQKREMELHWDHAPCQDHKNKSSKLPKTCTLLTNEKININLNSN